MTKPARSKSAKVPRGWRRLRRGEKLREGDKCLQWDGGWRRLDEACDQFIPVMKDEQVIRRQRTGSAHEGKGRG